VDAEHPHPVSGLCPDAMRTSCTGITATPVQPYHLGDESTQYGRFGPRREEAMSVDAVVDSKGDVRAPAASSTRPLTCGARNADEDANESARDDHVDHENQVPIK